MKWLRHSDSRGPSHKRSSFLAGMIALSAITFLYLNFDPTPAGADPAGRTMNVARLAAAIQVTENLPSQPASAAVPMPIEVSAKDSEDFRSEANRLAMMMNLVLVEQGRRRLMEMPDYTCTFYKQERVGSELLEGQFMQLKMRQKPFSVYMKWLNGEKGRELLYIDGEHDNKMVVHPGGWKSRLVPSVKIEPDGSLAMRESRHPVTMVGILKLSEEVVARRKAEIEGGHPVRCRFIEHQVVNERPCYCFIVTYLDRKLSEEYRKSVQYIDKELSLPICVKNYAWPEENQPVADEKALDEATLIEHYAYSDLQFNQQLAENDFSRSNKAYNFRR